MRFRGNIPAMTDPHQVPAQTTRGPSGTTMVANTLAIAGSIILVVIIMWGLVHLLSLSGGFLSSLFGGGDDGITVSAPPEVVSGEAFTISWEHEANENGMYALLYPCAEGLRFSIRAPNDARVTMPCGAAFAVGPATSSAALTPILVATSSVNSPMSVLFIPSSTSSAPVEGSVTLSIKPASIAPPRPSEPAPTPAGACRTGRPRGQHYIGRCRPVRQRHGGFQYFQRGQGRDRRLLLHHAAPDSPAVHVYLSYASVARPGRAHRQHAPLHAGSSRQHRGRSRSIQLSQGIQREQQRRHAVRFRPVSAPVQLPAAAVELQHLQLSVHLLRVSTDEPKERPLGRSLNINPCTLE
jgi:hypothetical protein